MTQDESQNNKIECESLDLTLKKSTDETSDHPTKDSHSNATMDKDSGLKNKKILFCGFSLSKYSPVAQFIFMVVGHMGFAITFSLLQEKVYRIEGFEYGGFMTLITVCTYTVCAWIEQMLSGNPKRKAKVFDYVFLSFFTFSGMYLTNVATGYLTYTSRLIIKSGKVIPVMIIGVIYLKKRYLCHQYLTAAVLVSGIVLFVLGDVSSSPNFDVKGVSLLGVAIFIDAFTANFEERRFFKERGSSHSEVMLYASLISIFISLITTYTTGELSEAIEFTADHPEVVPMIIAFSVVNYGSIICILLLISNFGSASSEIVKSSRKFTTMVLSYLVYVKPFTKLHFFGMTLFVLSLIFGAFMKQQAMHRHHAVKEPVQVVVEQTYVPKTNGHTNGVVEMVTS